MNKIVFTLSLLVSALAIQAQTNLPDKQAGLDSLYVVWEDNSQPDSSRVNAYVKYISKGFLYSKPDSAFILADELIAFGKKKNYPIAQSCSYIIKGRTHFLRGNYPIALDYYTKSLEISKQLGNQGGIADALLGIGTIDKEHGKYQKALDYFTQSLEINKQLGDQGRIASALLYIGKIHQEQGDYREALDYLTQSLEISKQSGDPRGIVSSLVGSIGIIYYHQGNYPKALDYTTQRLEINQQLGNQGGIAAALETIGLIYSEQGDYSKVLDYYTQSLEINEQLGDQRGIANLFLNIGNNYKEQGDHPKALDYYTQGLEIFEQLGDQRGIGFALLYLGLFHSEQGGYRKALKYCQKSYDLSLSVAILEMQKMSCKCLYDSYRAIGNSSKALVYLEKMRMVEDSLKSGETAKELQQMEFQKQVLADSLVKLEETRLINEAHKEELHQKNQTRNIALGGGLILFILAIGLYSRVRYIRKSKAVLQKEKDRSENLLLNILPAGIAKELKEKGRADARNFDMVSILFTDFKDFTAASEKLSAQDLVTEINICFEAFDGIMAKYVVEKIKTIGDAYMAAGGLPIPSDDSVKSTVLAALEIQAFITKRKTEMDAAGMPAFEMRVGVHTGPVVAGIVGVKKFQYDIWGDTVNTASRMESSGEVGQVNISQTTYELLKEETQFRFESRGKIEAKGKGEIEMYFVSKI